jgi:hypothetical protein
VILADDFDCEAYLAGLDAPLAEYRRKIAPYRMYD